MRERPASGEARAARVDLRPARVVAFHLPQFHPTPYNDEWWGKGFTEWTNVVQARPRFPGHYQPHVPADLGFYDLRLQEAREAQSELAAQYGVGGFLHYHYWMEGRRLLEEPVSRMLATGEPGLPFALCWANESWSRRWDGSENEVLAQQSYSEQDDLAHIRHLAEVFASPRYLRVEGKPLFAVYNTPALPDPRRTTDTWRAEAQRLGVGELFLCQVERFQRGDPARLGFDASIEFQPHQDFAGPRPVQSLTRRVQNRLRPAGHPQRVLSLSDYPSMVRAASSQGEDPYLRFAGVTPSWDNSARRKEWPVIFLGSTPELYEQWLASALRRPLHDGGALSEKLVFVNAWNEWAEGNHLEPDQKYGRAWLEATSRAVADYRRASLETGAASLSSTTGHT